MKIAKTLSFWLFFALFELEKIDSKSIFQHSLVS